MTAQFSVTENRPWKAPFFTIWGGQALSIFGSKLLQFALIWHLTAKSGSATVLATASLVGILPGVILGPLVGTLVDRWNRRTIMIIADSLVSATTIILAVLFALDAVACWQIYILICIRSLGGSFHSAAMNACTPLMVPVEHLVRIQGINQMLTGGLNVIAAPLGAVLLETFSIQGILGLDVVTGVLAILILGCTSIPQLRLPIQADGGSAPRASIWQDFRGGVAYLVGWRGLLIVSLMAVGINFTIIPAYSLLPLMVKKYFGGGALQLGWIQSAMAIGVLVGSLLLSTWGGFKQKIITAMTGVTGIGVGALVLAAAPRNSLSLAACGAFISGLGNPLTMGPFFAVLQSTVEPEIQARLFTLISSIASGVVPLGLMIAGPVADSAGVQTWFLLGGILCLVMAAAGLMIPDVMGIENRVSPAAN